jgi:asparagine synthase (glutamine-hydrolysing)
MCGFFSYEGKKQELASFEEVFKKLVHRGPDDSEIVEFEGGVVGFHRLAIMDLSHNGDQPFSYAGNTLVCNGEVYNYQDLKKMVDYKFQSGSDCEVILPLYERFGLVETATLLDAEYAFALWDKKKHCFVAARDPIGIRPLFYGAHKETGKLMFASEMKILTPYCDFIRPFPPGHVWDGKEFICYHDSSTHYKTHGDSFEEVCDGIHDKLVEGVRKRLMSDAPIGFLLSGGLDSSLVCSIAQKISNEQTGKPIKTFAIGMEKDAIDLKYAKIVADHIGSEHTEVIITKEDVLGSMREVIYHLETYDITTIRASIGMYLVCKYIHEKTDVKVLLTGEVSDEIFGYKYTDFAPSPEEFQKEAQKRVKELYMYDVLRADRCISAHCLEARVPFSDQDFVSYVMGIDPAMKMNTTGKGKYLLRKAFDRDDYLPETILWREKAAFSDAVGHSLVDHLKAYAEELYEVKDVEAASFKYKHATPFTKESLMYRDIFEEFYKGRSKTVDDFWMPNKEWEGCDVKDPSARVLSNYGASGV